MATSQPPTYEEATGSRRGPSAGPSTAANPTQRTRNGIPPTQRRSMEDEARPLPKGWVRTFDPETSHQFFVDTTKDPPRAIWQHPYDDDEYVASLSEAERSRLEGQGALLGHSVSQEDMAAESTDDEDGAYGRNVGGGGGANNESGRHQGTLEKLGRGIKDRLTSSTHAERLERRRRRAADEESAYRQHVAFRRGLVEAVRTGEPQLLGRDDDGREVYLEPPGVRHSGVVDEHRLSSYVNEVTYRPGSGPEVGEPGARFIRADGLYPGGVYNGGLGGGIGGGYGSMYRGMGPGFGYGGGLVRPYGPYRRPYGLGYGGGFGMPLAFPLMGGMMLGGLMF